MVSSFRKDVKELRSINGRIFFLVYSLEALLIQDLMNLSHNQSNNAWKHMSKQNIIS